MLIKQADKIGASQENYTFQGTQADSRGFEKTGEGRRRQHAQSYKGAYFQIRKFQAFGRLSKISQWQEPKAFRF